MKKFIYILLTILTIAIFFVISFFLISGGLEAILIPKDYLFFERNSFVDDLLFILLIIVVFLVAYHIWHKFREKLTGKTDDYLGILFSRKKFNKWTCITIGLWLLGIYLCFANFTYVTQDKIVVISLLHPMGQEYHYEDVEKIETGFGNKKYTLVDYEERGSFYYKITIEGKEIVFFRPSANLNVERYEDTYLELEEFDQALTSLEIPKTGSATGYEYCDFEKKYVDRFLRIIFSS